MRTNGACTNVHAYVRALVNASVCLRMRVYVRTRAHACMCARMRPTTLTYHRTCNAESARNMCFDATLETAVCPSHPWMIVGTAVPKAPDSIRLDAASLRISDFFYLLGHGPHSFRDQLLWQVQSGAAQSSLVCDDGLNHFRRVLQRPALDFAP